MKRFLVLTTILLIAIQTAFCQNQSGANNTNNNGSKVDQFLNVNGQLIEKEFTTIGEVKGLKVQVVHLTNQTTNEHISALVFVYVYADPNTSQELTSTAYIDSDEVDAFVNACKTIQFKILPTTPTDYVESNFYTAGGFELKCYWGKLNGLSKKDWIINFKLDSNNEGANVNLKSDDFKQVVAYLLQAQDKLKK